MSTRPATSRAAKADRVYTPPSDNRRRARAEHRRLVKSQRVYSEPEPGSTADSRRARRAAVTPPAPAGSTGGPTDAPGAAAAAAAPPPPPARGGGGGARPGQAVAGVIVGLFVWGYAMNWLRGGLPQANGWLAAKFLNEPYGGSVKAGKPGPAKGGNPLPPTTTRRAP